MIYLNIFLFIVNIIKCMCINDSLVNSYKLSPNRCVKTPRKNRVVNLFLSPFL